MAPNSKEQLLNSRESVHTRMKRIHNFVTEQYSSEKNTPEDMQVRGELLEKLWIDYDNIQLKLEQLEPNKHNDNRAEVEELYLTAMARIKKILNENTKKQHESDLKSIAATQEIPRKTEILKNNVSLPAIKVAEFDGKYDQWQGFYDVFMALIDADTSLSDIAKLFYLRSYVKGEAFKLIEAVPVSGENYKPTLQLLIDRYNNSQYIVNSHLKALFELPTVTKDAPRTLRLLISETKQHLKSLETLKLPVQHWDSMIVFMLTQKLDTSSRTAWELHRSHSELPKLSELYSFLENRCTSLESIVCQPKTSQKSTSRTSLATVSVPEKNCKLCDEKHNLYHCEKFKKMNYEERLKVIKDSKVCFNCLRFGHIGKHCTSQRCRTCGRKHNTLIHPPVQEQTVEKQGKQNEKEETIQATAATALYNADEKTQILLSTACVMVMDKAQSWIECKVLLDNASQCNFVTRRLVEKLGLRTYEKHVPINGINQTSARTSKAVQVTFASRYNKYKRTLEFLILDSITRDLPVEFINIESFNLPKELKLADTQFNQPSTIDMLIGGEIFFEILGSNKHALGENLPYIQSSALGWIISGRIQSGTSVERNCFLVTSEQLDQSLRKFWELEHCFTTGTTMSIEEKKCEEIFAKTTCQNTEGRYIVKLPLRESTQCLGDSYTNTEKRFKKLEFRISRNLELKFEYTKFMNEYIQLGHMQKIETTERDSTEVSYYIPHHAVYKDNDVKKIRVVFDASMATTNGKSLNDILMVGPVVQQELFSIIVRFRKHKIVFLADIKKMYRQILVAEEDRKLQRIIWRENVTEELGIYELQTVTYGTSAAPYLATKCLQHLTQNNSDYPLASKRIQNDTYVDDILTGADSTYDALKLQIQIIELLKTACLELHKWCSNSSEILSRVESSGGQQNNNPIHLGKDETKTLGLLWSPQEDKLKFVATKGETSQMTKRAILSTIASIFDPLGLLAPVTLKAKLIMQELWKLKVEWDSELNSSLAEQWQDWQIQIHDIKDLQVERRIIAVDNATSFQLHGFSDASQTAYGAALYLRAENDQGQVSVRLICSKSRVAPLKQVSLPRLELCGSHVLANLTHKVQQSLEIEFSDIYMWTDSTIVLSWLAKEPTKWTTFVANRVADIQDVTKSYKWRHVSSKQNPADLLTRGLHIEEMKTSELWWEGPQWLACNQENWPEQSFTTYTTNVPEERNSASTVLLTTQPNELFTRFSKLRKLQRVTAYCVRLFNNLKDATRNSYILTPEELNEALNRLIRLAQSEIFKTEIKAIQSNKQVPNNSNLKSLTPFLDEKGLLRVGGRLQNALIPYEQKHPLILPPRHPLTILILENEHQRLLHAGCQAVLASIKLKYWPIHGRSSLRKIIHSCMKCFRFRTQIQQQLMAQLPKERVQPARPFLHTGIDYAGPIFIKTGNRRNSQLQKAYIALFVCLSTRAIHLEAVTSLSTEAFINALRRFMSRRGKPVQIRSDNGTNFKGASNELRELYLNFKNDKQRKHILDYAANEGISWKFITANAPHQGGIWEAGIKSTKYHLKRIMGNSHLNYEEFATVLTEIEACLNSRPLFPINDDPLSFEILTPSHFLTGDVLTKIPVPDYTHTPENRLLRWQLVQKLNQQFWKLWSNQYLTQLQQRNKWQKESANVSEGMLVLVKEDNLPPLQWALARVKSVHPGSDGRVRIATVRTPRGTELQRPITKLCPLPVEDTSRAAEC